MRIAHVEWDPPGADWDGEYVEIENKGNDSQDMTGWTIADFSGHTYYFPDGFVLPGRTSVRVWTRSDTDTSNNLFWGRDSAVWGNEGDTAYLQDSEGHEIDSVNWTEPQ